MGPICKMRNPPRVRPFFGVLWNHIARDENECEQIAVAGEISGFSIDEVESFTAEVQ